MAASKTSPADTIMWDPSVSTAINTNTKESSAHDIFNCTISKPAHAYAQLELVTAEVISVSSPRSNHPAAEVELDALQVRSHCTAALKQYLGLTGVAIPIDVLKVLGRECWVRVPREDLPAFTTSITAWSGVVQEGTTSMLRVCASGNWLGNLIDRGNQRGLWTSPGTG